MPTVTESTIDALAFCPDARCFGYKQQPVQGVLSTTSVTCAELGGDLPMIERTFDKLRFANEADIPCEHCSRDRQISDQERPVYPSQTPVPQDALLHQGEQAQRVRDIAHAQELQAANDKAELAELRAAVAELKAAQAKPAPRKAA